MNAQERREKIYKILLKKSDTTVEELAKIFNKSATSIYNDLQILKNQKKIEKIYGGVKFITQEEVYYSFLKRKKQDKKIKSAIAKEAVSLIRDDDIIAIDPSSTANYMLNELCKENKKHITILTNSSTVFGDNSLLNNQNIDLIVIGGYLDKEKACMLSEVQEDFLSKIIINKFFFSAYGLSLEYRLTDHYILQIAMLKKYLFEHSIDPICLLSSDKFKAVGAYNWMPTEKLKTIITDEFVEDETVSALNNKGIEVKKVKI